MRLAGWRDVGRRARAAGIVGAAALAVAAALPARRLMPPGPSHADAPGPPGSREPARSDGAAGNHAVYLPSIRHGPYYEGAVTFAVVGDYGWCGMGDLGDCRPAERVAAMVAGWDPDFVVTTGDNNYPAGEAETWDVSTAPYRAYIPDRFEPAAGNHDYHCATCPESPFVDRFRRATSRQLAKPDDGNPLVRLFIVDSNEADPGSGTVRKKAIRREPLAPQRDRLRHGLAGLRACWKLVAMHHPPYTSTANPGPIDLLNSASGWTYRQWGADVVLAGHAHNYERITRDGGFAYIVNGAGGAPLDPVFTTPVAGSVVRIGDAHGAILGRADPTRLVLEYYTLDTTVPEAVPRLRDVHAIQRDCNAPRAGSPPSR